MIGKIIIGKSFRGCISYCLDKKEAELLSSNLCYGNKKELISQFNEVRRLNQNLSKPVQHITISLAKGSHLTRIKNFFDNHLDFYKYYRSGATYFDEIYFVRGKQDLRLIPDDLTLSIDTAFCTIQSYKASKLYANELLRIYLNTAIDQINRSDTPEAKATDRKLQWTGSKVSLIELIYAIQTAGVLNNGNADIKLLTSFFEDVFQVELGNVYNVFQEMSIRKKNRSQFMDLLKERLIQRMDQADEGY